jgi:hypothetical protein
MSLAQGQFFEHLARSREIRDVQYERHAGASLKREPLVDLAIQIELYGLPDFSRQDRACCCRIDPLVDVPMARIRVVGVGGDADCACPRPELIRQMITAARLEAKVIFILSSFVPA